MLVRVVRGQGTSDEETLVRAALCDPHSQVHDWLEEMAAWAERAFGNRTPSSRAADEHIAAATSKRFYNDLLDYVKGKHKEGLLTLGQLSDIERAGQITSNPDAEPSATQWQHAAGCMFTTLSTIRAELARELKDRYRSARRNSGDARGR
ncbi:hypothetical protein B7486_02030 [cyanobacterium TDX16]|nr:hypothetical protein B7486_02030 [cyanobacterium TDX16]